MRRTTILLLLLAAGLVYQAPSGRARAAEPSRSPFFLDYATQAHALTAGPEGAVWFIAEPLEGARLVLGKVTAGGEVSEEKLDAGRPDHTSIVSSPDGDLWFGEANAIGRRTATGEIRSYALPPDVDSPAALAVGPEGDLWFTESATGRIGRIGPDGRLREFSLQPGRFPNGIAAGPDGNLWFTERPANGVGMISPSGKIVEFHVPGPPANFGSIVAGADGNLWFTELAASRIGTITTTGVVRQFSVPTQTGTRGIVGGPGGLLYFLSGPEIAAIDATGRISWPSCFGGCHIGTNALTLGPDDKIWAASGDVSCVGLCGGGTGIALSHEPGVVEPYDLPPLTLGIGPHLTPPSGNRTSVLLACGIETGCDGTLRLGSYAVREHRYVFRTFTKASYDLHGGEARHIDLKLPDGVGRALRRGARIHVLVKAGGDDPPRAIRGFYLAA